MTIAELQIQLDLNPDNRVSVLENADTCRWTVYGYLFVDQEDGQCYLFDKDGNLDDINKVKRIERSAFERCESLTSIEIPNSVKRIGKWAFAYCTSLKSIKIPSSVKTVELGAFCTCKSLKSIKIPDSVKNIKDSAFAYCSSLTNITIPDSVESIREWAFEGCTSLKKVVFKGKTMKQVKTMENYPWEIEDESVIKCLD